MYLCGVACCVLIMSRITCMLQVKMSMHLHHAALHWARCVQAEMLGQLLSDKCHFMGGAACVLTRKDIQGLGMQAQKKTAGIVDFAYNMVAGCICKIFNQRTIARPKLAHKAVAVLASPASP